MKRIVTIAVAAVFTLFWLNACARDMIVTYDQLPQGAKTFIATHFADSQVSYAKLDDGKYEVRLADGTELDFTRAGEWDKVDCKYTAVPATVLALVPGGITAYVNANFPNSQIVKVDKERFSIEVELDNDLDLVFGKKGNFIRIDD